MRYCWGWVGPAGAELWWHQGCVSHKDQPVPIVWAFLQTPKTLLGSVQILQPSPGLPWPCPRHSKWKISCCFWWRIHCSPAGFPAGLRTMDLQCTAAWQVTVGSQPGDKAAAGTVRWTCHSPIMCQGSSRLTGQAGSPWAAARRALEESLDVAGNGDVFPKSPVLGFM